jgi:hypothetical protein
MTRTYSGALLVLSMPGKRRQHVKSDAATWTDPSRGKWGEGRQYLCAVFLPTHPRPDLALLYTAHQPISGSKGEGRGADLARTIWGLCARDAVPIDPVGLTDEDVIMGLIRTGEQPAGVADGEPVGVAVVVGPARPRTRRGLVPLSATGRTIRRTPRLAATTPTAIADRAPRSRARRTSRSGAFPTCGAKR